MNLSQNDKHLVWRINGNGFKGLASSTPEKLQKAVSENKCTQFFVDALALNGSH